MSRGGGQHGFDEAGFAAGDVTGVRWWQLRDGLLMGSRDYWVPGLNEARCLGSFGRHDFDKAFDPGHPVPQETCSCGFWAYWKQTDAPYVSGPRPVLGVIEGHGTGTLIGDKGFRCGKAKIVALCCMFTVKVPAPDPAQSRQGLWTPPEGMFSRGPGGGATFAAMTGHKPAQQMVDDAAALTLIESALEDRYQVTVYATAACMLLKHPPTTDYLPKPAPERLPHLRVPPIFSRSYFASQADRDEIDALMDRLTDLDARIAQAFHQDQPAVSLREERMTVWQDAKAIIDRLSYGTGPA